MRRLSTAVLLTIVALAVPAPEALALPGEYAPVDRPGPTLTVETDKLSAGVRCTTDAAAAGHPPVLLTAGTALSSREDFGWNWIPALQAEGIPYCTLDPPDAVQNMGDHHVRAEYVVHAIRHAYDLGGRRPISVVGHSQGGQIARWALRFWPDTRPMVDDVIGLASPNHGTVVARGLCVPSCAPAIWQQTDVSNYMAALNSGQETFADISYTNIYTHLDQFVQPNLDDSGTTSLHTGDGRITNVAVQDVCPLSVAEHIAVGTYDPVAHALAMDALRNDGPADPSRIDPAVCTTLFMPGVNALTFVTDYGTLMARIAQELSVGPKSDAEPALACYVWADCDLPAAQEPGSPTVPDAAHPSAPTPETQPAATPAPARTPAPTAAADDHLPTTGHGAAAAAAGLLLLGAASRRPRAPGSNPA